MSTPQPGISVAIPVYNSERSLPPLIERLGAVLPALAASYEVILVNDGSRDRSWDVVQALSRERPWVRGFCLMRNFGQHNALLCAIRAARYDTIITMDDDLQHPPEVLAELFAELREEVDVVYGPPLVERHGFFRDLASVVTKLCLKDAMNAETAQMVSALRIFRTRLREAFADFRSPYVNIDVLLTWSTNRFVARRVRHDARTIGFSNYTARNLLRHASNMMTGFSVLPLQVASLVGFVFTLFGMGVLAYVLLRYLIAGSPVPGFPFLASIISIFAGAQLFSLGIIGEYLARMHTRLMDKPSFVMRAETTRETPLTR